MLSLGELGEQSYRPNDSQYIRDVDEGIPP